MSTEQKEGATKDQIRALTLGSPNRFRTKTVEVNGTKIELRQPSVGVRSDLRRKVTAISQDGIDFNLFEFLIYGAIECCFVPGTQERVFESTDYEAFRNCAPGGWFDDLCEEVSKILNIGKEEEEKEEAKKN